ASGNKRAKMGCRGVEMKAGSFCHGCGLWGHGASVGPTISGWSRRGYEDIYGRSTPDAKVFQSVISPKVAKNPRYKTNHNRRCSGTYSVVAQLWSCRL